MWEDQSCILYIHYHFQSGSATDSTLEGNETGRVLKSGLVL